MSENIAEAEPNLALDPQRLEELKAFRKGFSRLRLIYQFGIDEVMTKINILKTEFEHSHEYSPIEHVNSRLKSPESIIEKIQRKGGPISLARIQEKVQDIAGVRIVCSFIDDVYQIADMLSAQPDISVVEVKDYIKNPKPNGYKSLHLIVKVPIFLSAGVEHAYIEIQFRTIGMDFWASLEHKIYYKFAQAIPTDVLAELSEAADIANRLDLKMQRIHNEVQGLRPTSSTEDAHQIELPSTLALSEFLTHD